MVVCFHRSLLVMLILGLVCVAWAADVEDAAEPPEIEIKYPFSIKLVDGNGQSVVDAFAGVTAYFGFEGNTLPAVDESGWRYWHGTKSNALGIAQFSDGGDAGHLCIVARDSSRKLVAIETIDSLKLNSEKTSKILTMTMHPECRVSGRLTCGELTNRNREVGWANVNLTFSGKQALGCSSGNQEFHFFLPPGEFKLTAYGTNMYFTEKTITVKSGQGELKLGEINLPATRLALLEGMPAPELGGAASWKNGPPVKLTELKGKCVLLDFWGYWCGPCVHQMPELFELYDKYNHQGLEIVGIHIDLGEDETTPVDSAEKLDARLTAKRKNLWKGRDIPFPVALFCGKRVPYGADVDGKARASISAQYGVMLYPTTILIDRQGNVVGRFAPQQQNDIDQLEKLLGEKQPN